MRDTASNYTQAVANPTEQTVSAYQAALDRAQVNLETQQNRRLNLELEKEFGAKVWQENVIQQERAIQVF